MKTKTFLFGVLHFLSLLTYAQNDKTVQWINQNAITIEDANPDTKLSNFHTNMPKKFAKAKIFGFGEATHYSKEFFDIKAKFFKYLVTHHGVKVFIMEDSYPAEAGINEWISGGKGDITTIANNFSINPWYCKEIVNLLAWMRNYNLSKSKDEQIRFYGMDIQNVKRIDTKIREVVSKYTIPVSEELLTLVDTCVAKKVDYYKSTDWADVQTPKLKKLERILVDFQKERKNDQHAEINAAIRALQYLIKYTFYVQHHYSQDRDLKMYENVKWILEHKSQNGKAFIWAHNEHINSSGFNDYSKRSIYNLGRHLKEQYKDDYYSVGFDFGKGVLPGYKYDKKTGTTWEVYPLDKPFSKTYAETLFKSDKDIYFIDMDNALHGTAKKFFSKKKKQLLTGGPGYNPKRKQLYKKKYSEMYDGLIFVKSVSVPNYKLNVK